MLMMFASRRKLTLLALFHCVKGENGVQSIKSLIDIFVCVRAPPYLRTVRFFFFLFPPEGVLALKPTCDVTPSHPDIIRLSSGILRESSGLLLAEARGFAAITGGTGLQAATAAVLKRDQK